jgi:hypothetical protein
MVTVKDIDKQLDDYFKDHRSLTDDEADAVAEVWLSKYLTRHITPNGVIMDDYHFDNGVTITLIPCKEINEL